MLSNLRPEMTHGMVNSIISKDEGVDEVPPGETKSSYGFNRSFVNVYRAVTALMASHSFSISNCQRAFSPVACAIVQEK